MEAQGPEGLLARDASGLRIWSCVTCRRRKVRCDRVDPACRNCTRNGIECHYPVTGRLPRRRPPRGDGASKAQRQDELIGRLRRLEAVVTEMSAQVEDGAREQGLGDDFSFRVTPRSGSASATTTTTASTSSTGEAPSASWPASVVDGMQAIPEPEAELGEDFGQLVEAKDGALHIGRRFWTVFCDEVDNIFRAVEDVEEASDDSPPLYADAASRVSPYRPQTSLGFTSGNSSEDEMFPLPSQMPLVWDTYARKVDPFTKILHVPDMETLFQSLQHTPVNTLNTSTQALVATICFGATAAMEPEEVQGHFGRSKPDMMARARTTVEQALMRAGYMTTRDMTVLTAFVLYVAILPHTGCAELAWPLVGMVLRLAISMKLHKDGAHDTTMPFFEAEMRRRLWWHICFADSCARDPDIPPDLFVTEAMFDTQMPLPIDGRDLALMDAPPPSSSLEFKSGEMTLTLIRCEIWRAMRKLEPGPGKPLQVRLDLINAFRSRIDAQYLQRLRPDVPFDGYVRTLTTLVFAKIEVVILLEGLRDRRLAGEQAGTVADVILQSQIFAAALAVVEGALALRTRADLADWAWCVRGHVPWHTMGILLRHLYRQPWGAVPERAWRATRAVYDALPPEAAADPLWATLSGLVARVEAYRRQQCEPDAGTEGVSPCRDRGGVVHQVAVEKHHWDGDGLVHAGSSVDDFFAGAEFMDDPAMLDTEGWQSWAGMIGVGSVF